MDNSKIAIEEQIKVAGFALMSQLRAEFPAFESSWANHIASWDDDSPGAYLDISTFAHFIDEEVFEQDRLEGVRQAFMLLEQLFVAGDEPTRDLIGIGFIEDLQNYSSRRPNGAETVARLLPRTLAKVWKQIERQWAGHGSLMEVIGAERSMTQSSWADLLDLKGK